jgi:hypothetical protein
MSSTEPFTFAGSIWATSVSTRSSVACACLPKSLKVVAVWSNFWIAPLRSPEASATLAVIFSALETMLSIFCASTALTSYSTA